MFKVATYVGQNLKISDSFHSFCEALMVEIGLDKRFTNGAYLFTRNVELLRMAIQLNFQENKYH